MNAVEVKKVQAHRFNTITVIFEERLCFVGVDLFLLAARFLLKKTKPGLVSSNSSARLLEDVIVEKDNYDHLIQSSRVRDLNFV